MFEKAIERDQGYAEAYAQLCPNYFRDWSMGLIASAVRCEPLLNPQTRPEVGLAGVAGAEHLAAVRQRAGRYLACRLYLSPQRHSPERRTSR
jgi:hypothetical protein